MNNIRIFTQADHDANLIMYKLMKNLLQTSFEGYARLVLASAIQYLCFPVEWQGGYSVENFMAYCEEKIP